MLFPGTDPTPTIEALGKKFGLTEANGKFVNISMGQGQEQMAVAALNKCAKEGGWIMLQNIHLMQDWLPLLERALELIDDFAHDDFRCILTSEPPGALQGPLCLRSTFLQPWRFCPHGKVKLSSWLSCGDSCASWPFPALSL